MRADPMRITDYPEGIVNLETFAHSTIVAAALFAVPLETVFQLP